eukprot:SAG11_NODE_1611_length_4583_cov_3.380687_8_plen_81_part_00
MAIAMCSLGALGAIHPMAPTQSGGFGSFKDSEAIVHCMVHGAGKAYVKTSSGSSDSGSGGSELEVEIAAWPFIVAIYGEL